MSSKTNKKGLEPNKNRELGQPVPPLEKLYEKSANKEQASKLWTGQKINFGGKMLARPPAKSRIVKEALYNTGAKRVFDRHTGSGRPLKEAPKKSGAGGHNWGWPGIEIGVELASKEELRQLDRQFNPTAPDADEEPHQWKETEADEEWEGEHGAEFDDMEGLTGWEYSIAGEERAQTWPGYWQGLEGVRTLYGDQLGADEFTTNADLPHATWQFGANFMAEQHGIEGEELEKEDREKRVALKVGGPPQWAEKVAWGHKESERAAFEGVPVIPWGEEPERTNPLTRGIADEGRAPASRGAGGELPDEGPLGLEAERLMSSSRREEAPASFINRDIKTVVMKEGGIAEKIGEGKGGEETMREVLEAMKQQGQPTRFEIGENISLPSS
jgi:hypothetical protein